MDSHFLKYDVTILFRIVKLQQILIHQYSFWLSSFAVRQTSSGEAVIICEASSFAVKQTSFKKVTFVLTDTGTLFDKSFYKE